MEGVDIYTHIYIYIYIYVCVCVCENTHIFLKYTREEIMLIKIKTMK